MKIFFLCLVLMTSVFAISASKTYKASGAVVDLVQSGKLLYVATDASVVDIFDIKSTQKVNEIKVDKIKDFVGDLVDSKVYSVDVLSGKTLVLSQTKQGYRRVHILENKKMDLVIDASSALPIAKAKFINENTIILALLSNEIISYDIKTKKQNWIFQASGAKFSNFALNEDRSQIVIADESGDIRVHSTKDGKSLKVLSGQNLDNVFQVDVKNGVIATAGQDRRVVVYKNASAYYKQAPFLIYSVGLSPSGDRVGYSSDENNNVTVFDTQTRKTIAQLSGNKMTLTSILFLNENEILVSSDASVINYYKLKDTSKNPISTQKNFRGALK